MSTDLTRTTWSFPTTLRFGKGVVDEMGALLKERGVGCPLLVTDRGVAALPIFERLRAVLSAAEVPYTVYGELDPNPHSEHVSAGAEAFRSGSCDSVVGFGGGSALDAAKAIAVVGRHEGSILDYDAAKEGWTKIDAAKVPPILAVPTTAGTGSEVGRSAVITCVKTEKKRFIFSPALMPSVALLDPELTLELPPGVTAATGMDALSHCIESYLSPVFHPYCDSIAIGGIGLIARSLERAVHDGQEDLEARADMLIAASMGATAFQKDLGATHALAHPLSSIAGVPHGTANGMMLARVMRFNVAAVPERLVFVGEALRPLGLGSEGKGGDTTLARAQAACEAVAELARRIGIPQRLGKVGVDEDMLEPLARAAFDDPCHKTNPRKCTYEDLLGLYREAL
ncbi:iron-containing alcohol dehydrogenase [Planctomycetota bacterium]